VAGEEKAGLSDLTRHPPPTTRQAAGGPVGGPGAGAGRPLLRPAWFALRRRLLCRRQAVRLAVLLLVRPLLGDTFTLTGA
jgi:hypothetical protein